MRRDKLTSTHVIDVSCNTEILSSRLVFLRTKLLQNTTDFCPFNLFPENPILWLQTLLGTAVNACVNAGPVGLAAREQGPRRPSCTVLPVPGPFRRSCGPGGWPGSRELTRLAGSAEIIRFPLCFPAQSVGWGRIRSQQGSANRHKESTESGLGKPAVLGAAGRLLRPAELR